MGKKNNFFLFNFFSTAQLLGTNEKTVPVLFLPLSLFLN